jgi:hypothetical protein
MESEVTSFGILYIVYRFTDHNPRTAKKCVETKMPSTPFWKRGWLRLRLIARITEKRITRPKETPISLLVMKWSSSINIPGRINTRW